MEEAHRMLPEDLDYRVAQAVAHYWQTLHGRQDLPSSESAHRIAAVGGRQMDGFVALILDCLQSTGLPTDAVHWSGRADLTLPGYYRATKNWDLLVVHEGELVAALELKSHRGPSFGNNFNNRTEEALGSAQDLWDAWRLEAFGKAAPKPWLGWLMLVEDAPGSRRPVKVDERHYRVFSEFRDASYVERYHLLAQRLLLQQVYDGAAVLISPESADQAGDWLDFGDVTSIRRFLSGLTHHVSHTLESRG